MDIRGPNNDNNRGIPQAKDSIIVLGRLSWTDGAAKRSTNEYRNDRLTSNQLVIFNMVRALKQTIGGYLARDKP